MNYIDIIEKRTHGTPDFPLAYYYVDETHPHYQMPFHWHRELEISYIIKGSYTFYLNDQEITASEGDVVFIDHGVIHGGKPDHCVYQCVVFAPRPLLPSTETCRNMMRKLISSHTYIPPYFPKGSHPICEATKNLMAAASDENPGKELNTLAALYQWFYTLYQTETYTTLDEKNPPSEEKIQALKPVLELIHQNYMQHLTLQDLAAHAGMSEGYFCRFFKKLIHQRPIEYLNYYRLECACYLLATTTLPITEVAYRCGFTDSCYFIYFFRKNKGITPKEYQKQYQ